MIDRTRDVMRGFTLAALLCALAGCSESDEPKGDKREPSDPVEVAAEELGTPVTGCSNSGLMGTTLTLTLGADPAVISAPSGKINVNGYICTGTVGMAANTQLTTANVKKIVLNGSADDNKVIFDLLPGSFGTTIFGNMGGVTVDFSLPDGAANAGDDTFMIRGGVNAETFKFAKRMGMDEVYLEVTNDKVADILVKLEASQVVALTASMGGGADTVIGNPVAADIVSFGGASTTPTMITVEKMALGFTAYGGVGDDKFTGGDGDDTFHGGDGADTFRTASADDGSDTYIGDSGSDTVDYSNRTDPVNADIGPARVSILGTEDLAPAVIADLDTLTLEIDIDGAGGSVVTFAAPTSPADVVAQINAVVAGVASITGKNQLLIMSTTSTDMSSVEIVDGTALAALGFVMGASATPIMGTATVTDADDGYAMEGDDIRPTTENITGGTGNDTLIGDGAKNTIKGGNGDDAIMGGSNTTCNTPAEGDVLQGEAGNDTFWLPVENNCAALTGGTGDNVVDFSGRSTGVLISNNGVANDGTDTTEKVNVAADILKMVGGFGDDTITGGAGNDWIVGGLGADDMSGGAGIDVVDYTARATAIDATPCFTATIGSCANPGDDGADMEGDEIHLVEHLKGGSGIDTFDATGATVDVIFEGNAGADALTGGNGNDQLWGDADNDVLIGGAGDDNITGGAGNDTIQGGDGDGDVCVGDAADMTAATGCELI